MIEIATDRELYEQAALAEFAALRTEALQALSMEWNIIALQLTATGVLFSFALTNHSRIGFLLIVPVVSYVLSGRYLRNDRAFILIGVYIKTDLSIRVPGLNFEWWYKSFPDPNPSRTLQKLAYGPAVFSGISIVALTWLIPYIFHPKNHISSFSGWMLGIAWVREIPAAPRHPGGTRSLRPESNRYRGSASDAARQTKAPSRCSGTDRMIRWRRRLPLVGDLVCGQIERVNPKAKPFLEGKAECQLAGSARLPLVGPEPSKTHGKGDSTPSGSQHAIGASGQRQEGGTKNRS